MQQMLVVFDYLKRYHSDIFDAIAILLEIITLRRYSSYHIVDLLNKAKKRKPIIDDFNAIMRGLFGDLYVEPNSNINLIKILKAINEVDITDEKIEFLINTITQKKLSINFIHIPHLWR